MWVLLIDKHRLGLSKNSSKHCLSIFLEEVGHSIRGISNKQLFSGFLGVVRHGRGDCENISLKFPETVS